MISACRLHFLIRRRVAGGSGEVRPGDVCLISGSGYSKDKQFKGGQMALALRAYFSAATGLSQHVGIEIHESEAGAQHAVKVFTFSRIRTFVTGSNIQP